MIRAGLLATALMASWSLPEAAACSLAPIFEDGGRYVGGDLAQQIAARAYTVQLVRARRDRQIGVTSERQCCFGRLARPIYAFEFEVVETLAARDLILPLALGRSTAPGSFTLDAFARERRSDGLDRASIWVWPTILDRPGSEDGYGVLRGPAPVSQSGGSCGQPMYIEEGELFIALRAQTGALYAFSGFGVESDHEGLRVDYVLRPGSRAIEQRNAPPLIRVTGRNDPLYTRIRDALSAIHRLRRQ